MFAPLPNHSSLFGTGRFGEDESKSVPSSATEGDTDNALDKREQLPTTTQLKRTTYPTNLSDQQWAAAQRVIPVERCFGRPRTTDR